MPDSAAPEIGDISPRATAHTRQYLAALPRSICAVMCGRGLLIPPERIRVLRR